MSAIAPRLPENSRSVFHPIPDIRTLGRTRILVPFTGGAEPFHFSPRPLRKMRS